MARHSQIVVSGAREHNLKDVTVALPRDALVVITGLSGSGKSSLAFDTIYAEGQRRYVESLSAYARQFLGPDGQARRRLDRGSVAGDLDRPEDDVAQPALDGRHRHRDLRLPAPAVVADRQAALPHLRQAGGRPVGRADHRPGHGAARGHAVHGPGADRPGAQGRVRQALRGAARRGLRARRGRRRAALARGGRSSSTRSSSTTSRWSSTGWSCAARSASAWPTRSRPRSSLADGMVEVETVPRDDAADAPPETGCTPRSSPAPTTAR